MDKLDGPYDAGFLALQHQAETVAHMAAIAHRAAHCENGWDMTMEEWQSLCDELAIQKAILREMNDEYNRRK